MAVQQIYAIQIIAKGSNNTLTNGQSVIGLMADASTDCPILAQLARSAPQDSLSQVDGNMPVSPLCKGCTTCQLCMALVTGYPAMLGASIQLPQTALLLGTTIFTSAERAPGFKPPIS